MYYKGNGVKLDIQQGIKWLTKAAEQGQVNAQFNLALLYYQGIGVKAIELFTDSAEQGKVDAQYNLGRIYLISGDVVKNDRKKGGYWICKAYEQKNYEAEDLIRQITSFGSSNPISASNFCKKYL